MLFHNAIQSIQALDPELKAEAQKYLDSLAKPVGSIGQVEKLAVQIAAIQNTLKPNISTSSLIVCAGDHGIVEEGVTPFPREVTPAMVANFAKGKACVNQFANATDTRVNIYDVGVYSDTSLFDGVVQAKVRRGTANFAKEPALTSSEVHEALEVGINAAYTEIDRGADILAIGEMGIGNSTPAAALVAAFTGADINLCVGAGTGLDAKGIAKKAEVIKRSFERAFITEGKVVSGKDEAIRVLSEVGGLEIIMMAGVVLGAASRRVPIIADGFISAASVLAAHALAPDSTDYVVFSHLSVEPGHNALYAFLKATPLLKLDMRLGEGTGAVLAVPIAKAAANMMSGMATLAETMG